MRPLRARGSTCIEVSAHMTDSGTCDAWLFWCSQDLGVKPSWAGLVLSVGVLINMLQHLCCQRAHCLSLKAELAAVAGNHACSEGLEGRGRISSAHVMLSWQVPTCQPVLCCCG